MKVAVCFDSADVNKRMELWACMRLELSAPPDPVCEENSSILGDFRLRDGFALLLYLVNTKKRGSGNDPFQKESHLINSTELITCSGKGQELLPFPPRSCAAPRLISLSQLASQRGPWNSCPMVLFGFRVLQSSFWYFQEPTPFRVQAPKSLEI